MKIALHMTKNRATASQWQSCAHIWLTGYKGDSQGNIFLSSDCMTSVEVIETANKLIKQLQDVKRRATKAKWNNRPGN
jgi:hypothetical protein